MPETAVPEAVLSPRMSERVAGKRRCIALLAMLVSGSLQLTQASADDAAENWQPLFDGQTLAGWRGYAEPAVPAGWIAEDGILHFTGQGEGGGDIVTVATFENFELELEWKLGPGGNSGIFYLAALSLDRIYLGAPEMQILDDAQHRDGGDPLTSAGANYALHPAPRGVVKPVGEWNAVRIRVDHGQVEHWLNGQKIVSYELGSPDWQARVAAAKFKDWPAYGQARRGHIGLQDHGDPVWFRGLRIRELD